MDLSQCIGLSAKSFRKSEIDGWNNVTLALKMLQTRIEDWLVSVEKLS